MRKLLIATRNQGKIPGIITQLSGISFEVIGINDTDLPKEFVVVEDRETFKENAILKAKTYGKKTGLLTLADDSGLCVDALGGRPGVMSARYAPGTAQDRNAKVLIELQGVPEQNRTARYVCVIAIYDPQTDNVVTFEGKCEGLITEQPVGENGFGFDPIFFSPEFKKTYAQITTEDKNSISHRGKAMKKVREYLLTL